MPGSGSCEAGKCSGKQQVWSCVRVWIQFREGRCRLGSHVGVPEQALIREDALWCNSKPRSNSALVCTELKYRFDISPRWRDYFRRIITSHSCINQNNRSITNITRHSPAGSGPALRRLMPRCPPETINLQHHTFLLIVQITQSMDPDSWIFTLRGSIRWNQVAENQSYHINTYNPGIMLTLAIVTTSHSDIAHLLKRPP